jgi:hypothetical protein
MPDEPRLWIDQDTWGVTGPGRLLPYTEHELQALEGLLACPVCGGSAAAVGIPTPDAGGGELKYILTGRWECVYRRCQERNQPPGRRS